MYAVENVNLTQSGFLCDPQLWTPDVAEALAQAEGVELTDAHWLMLNAIREFYETNEVQPTSHVIRREVREALQPFESNFSHAVKYLFPQGGIKQASRIAGLPHYYCFGC